MDEPMPTPEEVELMQMIGGPFAGPDYYRECLPLLRANATSDGVYKFGKYPMASPPSSD